MTAALLIIFSLEVNAMNKLFRKYGVSEYEEFFASASLDDIIRYRTHGINSWMMIGFLTILSCWRAP